MRLGAFLVYVNLHQRDNTLITRPEYISLPRWRAMMQHWMREYNTPAGVMVGSK